MGILEIKSKEMIEIREFCEFIEDYGHIFYAEPEYLDEPFRKILEGIKEVTEIVRDCYEM